MSTIKPGTINLKNLRIARENAGYSTMAATNIVAKNKANRDRIKEWEQREHVYQDIEKLANKYQVSPEFVFYRLDDLGLFHPGTAQAIRQRVKKETQHRLKQRAEEEARRKQSGKSGGSSNNAMKDSNGRLFNNFLLALYMEDKITPVEATNALRLALEQVL